MKLKFKRDEAIWFLLFLAVSLIPFWLVKYIPSLDGPTHLHNARLIHEILKADPLITQYYSLNPVLVGNSTAHYTMALLMFIFPAWLSEKFLLTFYIIGLVFSFRYFVRSSDRSGSLLYLVIIPFGFHSLFLFGYYNFSLAFIPLFFTLGFIKRKEGQWGVKEFILLILLFLAIYISHAVVFVFAGLILFIQMIIEACYDLWIRKEPVKKLKKLAGKYLFLLGAAIPSIILWIIYFLSLDNDVPEKVAGGAGTFIKNLINLLNLKFLVGFNQEQEEGPIIITMITLAALLLIIVARHRIIFRRSGAADADKRYEPTLWGTISAVLILLLFLLPDHMTTGSITVRFNILLYFTLIAWLSLYKLSRSLVYIALTLIFCAFSWHRYIMFDYYKELNKLIDNIESADSYIPPNSIVYPINCTENWLEGHFHCYLGVDKPIIDLRNPQAGGQMPVVWNFKKMPNVLLGKQELETVGISWLEDVKNRKDIPVDYIFVLKPKMLYHYPDAEKLLNDLSIYYSEIYRTSNGTVLLSALK